MEWAVCTLCHGATVLIYRLVLTGNDCLMPVCAVHRDWFEDYLLEDSTGVLVLDRLPAP